MGTDERLARLGLSHLKDKPEELKKELARCLAELSPAVEAWHEEQRRRFGKAFAQDLENWPGEVPEGAADANGAAAERAAPERKEAKRPEADLPPPKKKAPKKKG